MHRCSISVGEPETPHEHRDGLSKPLRDMGVQGKHATHGFRGTIRTIARERLGVDIYVLEAQLAHAKRGDVKNAYDRTTLAVSGSRSCRNGPTTWMTCLFIKLVEPSPRARLSSKTSAYPPLITVKAKCAPTYRKRILSRSNHQDPHAEEQRTGSQPYP